jgi:hypothetical protein
MSEDMAEKYATITRCDEAMIQASDSCLQEDEIDTLDTFIACVEGIGSHVTHNSNTGSNLCTEDQHHHPGLPSDTNDDEDQKVSRALEGLRTSRHDTIISDEEDAIVTCKTTEEVLESMVKSGYDMMTMCTGTQLSESSSKQPTPIHAKDDDDDLYCAICLAVPNLLQPFLTTMHNANETDSATTVCQLDGFAHLPCCGGKDGKTEQTTSTKICTKCLLILCTPTSDGQASVGRCPRCRSWISISSSQETVAITKASNSGQCKVCYQVKAVLVPVDGSENNNLCCDACYLGVRNPLLYQCQSCTQSQRIPHPMYRYQTDGPNQYGHDTWACQRCSTFTKWKILPSQIPLIPPGDVPEAWGEEFDAMAVARARVQRHQREDPDNHHQTFVNGLSSSCRIS